MRLTLCTEGITTDGRVLASISREDIMKMVMLIFDNMDHLNRNNPKMFKHTTNMAYQCGYSQGRVDAINDFKKSVKEMIVDLDAIRFKDIEDIAALLKEQDK